MENSIFHKGKEYISASRAAKTTDYSSDYVGQLCRSGKVIGKLVGRTWYVDMDSLNMHKHNTKPGRVGGSASLYRRNVGPVIYGSENLPLYPALSKRKGKSAQRVIVNIEKIFALTVITVLFGLGSNSILESENDLLLVEDTSVSLASALESVSVAIPYEEVVSKVEKISVFDASLEVYEVVRKGFEDMRELLEDSKI